MSLDSSDPGTDCIELAVLGPANMERLMHRVFTDAHDRIRNHGGKILTETFQLTCRDDGKFVVSFLYLIDRDYRPLL